MKYLPRTLAALSVTFAAVLAVAATDVAVKSDSSASTLTWDKPAAARYLDKRQTWWMSWPTARRDHETACISCHTAVPYALSRQTLRTSLGETAPSQPEVEMLGYVNKRVGIWTEAGPFYDDQHIGLPKTSESRGTESVLNSLVLASYDAPTGKLSDNTRKALDAMWALQLKSGEQSGSWAWLNFHLAPWETTESPYYGASLAAVAVGRAPEEYRDDPKIQQGLTLLRTYLKSKYDDQPMMNRIVLLWASARISGLLTPEQKGTLEDSLYTLQQGDGGWNLASFGPWKRLDKTESETRSDAYATGLTAFALQQAGVSRDQEHVRKALLWLTQHQDRVQGLFPAYSLNKQRDPATDIGKFMSDAATGFAVMALQSQP